MPSSDGPENGVPGARGDAAPSARRPYEPPRIEQIEINPAEALLSGGKQNPGDPGGLAECGVCGPLGS
jgi:hypothetical protein